MTNELGIVGNIEQRTAKSRTTVTPVLMSRTARNEESGQRRHSGRKVSFMTERKGKDSSRAFPALYSRCSDLYYIFLFHGQLLLESLSIPIPCQLVDTVRHSEHCRSGQWSVAAGVLETLFHVRHRNRRRRAIVFNRKSSIVQRLVDERLSIRASSQKHVCSWYNLSEQCLC